MLEMLSNAGINWDKDMFEAFIIIAMRGTKDKNVVKALLKINNKNLLELAEIGGSNFRKEVQKNLDATTLLGKMLDEG